MQTTDLIGTGIALLGTRLLAEGPLLLTRSHDEALQLNLSGQSPDFLAAPFFPHPETPLSFSEFLESMAKKGSRSIRMISAVTEAETGLPERIREGFQGTSHLMIAAQTTDHVLAYKPYIHQEACTDLELVEILAFLDQCHSREEIESMLLDQIESPEATLEASLHRLGTNPSRHFFEVLGLLFSSPEMHDEDRHAWENLVRSRHVAKNPAFPFVFEGGFAGKVERLGIEETLPAYEEVLQELILWCGYEGLESWQHRYSMALQDLELEDPEAVHPVFQLVQDYCPGQVSRFYRSASRAWAFGGLNSWNDIPQAGSERYEELTENLLLGIKGAVLTTANWEFEYSPWC